MDVDAELAARLGGLDTAELRERFLDGDEFLTLTGFLPERLLAALQATLPALAGNVHRNFVPGHKKGGSISRFVLDRAAAVFGALYRAPSLRRLLEGVTGRALLDCPARDPHTYALYWYTEPGDHIGYHYDTSYYRGARYTVLLGLVDESSSRLRYELYRRAPGRTPVPGELALEPGRLVLFNGDRLWHAVSPLGPGERRVVLTMEYLTDAHMSLAGRMFSDLKDAVAYFGLRQVFGSRTAGRGR